VAAKSAREKHFTPASSIAPDPHSTIACYSTIINNIDLHTIICPSHFFYKKYLLFFIFENGVD